MDIITNNTVDVITIKEGFWEIDFTAEEVQEIYLDKIFLQNAVLSLLNPEACDKSDLPNLDYKQLLKEYFTQKELNYDQDFIQKVFK